MVFRPFGALTLLSTLMCEVVKILMSNNSEEEVWSWEARDILLDAWTAILVVYVFCAQICIYYHFEMLFVKFETAKLLFIMSYQS